MAKVCAVIGVGPGMGMACVKKWAAEGYKVFCYHIDILLDLVDLAF